MLERIEEEDSKKLMKISRLTVLKCFESDGSDFVLDARRNGFILSLNLSPTLNLTVNPPGLTVLAKCLRSLAQFSGLLLFAYRVAIDFL